MPMTLSELLALLPDNTTGAIGADDMRTVTTELWNQGVATAPVTSVDGETGAVNLTDNYLAVLTPTTVKTGAYPAVPRDLVLVNVSGGGFTVTLPSAPAAGSLVGVMVDTGHAAQLCTVACGGTDHFQRATGPITKTCNLQDQLWVGEYRSGVWYTVVDFAPQLTDSTSILVNVSAPGKVSFDATPETTPTSTVLTGNTKLMSVRVATVVALPANTYANGSAGVGATLTGTANGALAAVDGVTLAVDDYLVVKNEAAPVNNGIYRVTQVGDGANPYVLTRSAYADFSSEYAKGVAVLVAQGTVNAGALLRSTADTVTVNIGTTALHFRDMTGSTGQMLGGSDRDMRRTFEDFEQYTGAAITTTSTYWPGPGNPVIFLSGAGTQASQIGDADGTIGSCALATGTTATGFAAVALTNLFSLSLFDPTRPYRCGIRLKIPTVTTGVEGFVVRAGLLSGANSAAAPAAGIYWEAAADASSWKAHVRHASVSTIIDSTIVPGTGFATLGFYYDPDQRNVTFFRSNDVPYVQTTLTNLPTTGDSLVPCVHLTKTVGATSRTVNVDLISAWVKEMRAGMWWLP